LKLLTPSFSRSPFFFFSFFFLKKILPSSRRGICLMN
jgi:hypothetical protein